MTAHTRPGHRIGWGIAGVAATMAVAVSGAPAASADIDTLSIYPGNQTVVTGAKYGLYVSTPRGDRASWVSFYDNGQCIGSTRIISNSDLEGPPFAYMNWIPQTPGPHTITANDGRITKTLAVDVQPTPTGSTPATPGPNPAGCGALDRLLNSGSAAPGSLGP
ncbi:hypothetical protein [Nocardia tengchongensis]|uniref:hypothetical protein n=2 Tax=Nocardia tengchongensis TaxID=2055889 RepID=UPI0036AA3AC5